jgi:hypothetical protein
MPETRTKIAYEVPMTLTVPLPDYGRDGDAWE